MQVRPHTCPQWRQGSSWRPASSSPGAAPAPTSRPQRLHPALHGGMESSVSHRENHQGQVSISASRSRLAGAVFSPASLVSMETGRPAPHPHGSSPGTQVAAHLGSPRVTLGRWLGSGLGDPTAWSHHAVSARRKMSQFPLMVF